MSRQNSATALVQYCVSKIVNTSSFSLPHESFETASLRRDFSLLEIDSFRGQKIDTAPPTKRRKISNQGGLLDEITVRLYQLLGSQQATDLVGLSDLAEFVFPITLVALLTTLGHAL